jgi:hypothetical protein
MDNKNKIDIYRELEKQLNDRKNRKGCLFTDSYISICLDEENRWLYVDWTGYQTEESIMNGGEQMLNAMRKTKVSQVLNDNTNVIGIWTPAAKWTGEVWFPAMMEAGLKHFAWIMSPHRLSQVSTDEAIKNTSETDPIRKFDTMEEAKKWLRSVKSMA